MAPGNPTSGVLVVDEDRLLLKGRSAEDRIELSVLYADLQEVRIGRSPEEQLNGRPSLVLERDGSQAVQITPHGAGLIHELADLLTALATEYAEGDEEVAVIVPLKKGQLQRVKELVAKGPPFDPAALGFTRHEVLSDCRQGDLRLCRPARAGEARAHDSQSQPLAGRTRVARLH